MTQLHGNWDRIPGMGSWEDPGSDPSMVYKNISSIFSIFIEWWMDRIGISSINQLINLINRISQDPPASPQFISFLWVHLFPHDGTAAYIFLPTPGFSGGDSTLNPCFFRITLHTHTSTSSIHSSHLTLLLFAFSCTTPVTLPHAFYTFDSPIIFRVVRSQKFLSSGPSASCRSIIKCLQIRLSISLRVSSTLRTQALSRQALTGPFQFENMPHPCTPETSIPQSSVNPSVVDPHPSPWAQIWLNPRAALKGFLGQSVPAIHPLFTALDLFFSLFDQSGSFSQHVACVFVYFLPL